MSVPLAGSRPATRLPLGLFDGARRRLVAAVPLSDAARTTISVVDAATGATLRAATIAGRYSTQSPDYSGATLSYNGRWLALRAIGINPAHTALAVLDTTTLRVARFIVLPGHFGLDAIDAKGARLYLIEPQPARGPEAYRVRLLDLSTGALDPQAIVAKGDTTATMSGVAWTRAWSGDGDWLFTVYVRAGHRGAFIHALGVDYGIAECIDLPSGGADAAALSHYALAVGPDGQGLYAVDPVIGRLFAMRDGLQSGNPESDILNARAGSSAHLLNGLTVSADGQRLFVATNSGVWVVGVWTTRVDRVYLPGQRISSVVTSVDGRRLYALDSDRHAIEEIDAASGAVLGVAPAAPGTWAIAQIAGRS